jgi:hypothetical protein
VSSWRQRVTATTTASGGEERFKHFKGVCMARGVWKAPPPRSCRAIAGHAGTNWSATTPRQRIVAGVPPVIFLVPEDHWLGARLGTWREIAHQRWLSSCASRPQNPDPAALPA